MVQAIHDSAEHTGRAHAITQEDGTFELEALGETPLNIVVGSRKTGFAFQAGVRPGAHDVVLRLSPGGTIRVRVLGADGEPEAGHIATGSRKS